MHKIIEKNYNTITVNLKKNEIVGKEMEKLEDNTKLYDRIGRM
jgi:chaperonin cofactor prefoldin